MKKDGINNPNPILRDEKGRIVAGSGALNPAGRPLKKRDILDKLMKNFYGDDCKKLLLDVVEIAQYDFDAEYKKTDEALRKYLKPKFTNIQIVDARKFLFTHFYGTPLAETHTELSAPDDKEWSIEITHMHPKNKTKE